MTLRRSVDRRRSMGLRRSLSLLATGLVAVGVSACGGGARSATTTAVRTSAGVSSAALTPHPAGPSCAAAAPTWLAVTAGLVARRIYAQERASSGVSADQRQVEQNTPLLDALASGDQPAVLRAVTNLVYSGTHVVRLRVTKGGAVLADVGGPYILAPVGGALRLRGRTVGRYLLSVQDDLGYVKLQKRFIGYPLVMFVGSTRLPLEGTLDAGTASIPAFGIARYGGARYEVYTFNAQAFPSGPLRISLLVPAHRTLAAESCAQIRIAELTRIAERIWRRFTLAGAPLSARVNAIRSLTGSLSYVRAGAQQIAGNPQPGPSRLPASGTVRYRGLTYEVSSFAVSTPTGPARVYELIAP